MENIKAGSVIILSLQFLRSFGGFSNAKSAGFWGGAPDPDGGASSAPPYPLAGREGCPLPHPLPHPPRDGSAYSQPLPFSAPPSPQPSRLDPLVIMASRIVSPLWIADQIQTRSGGREGGGGGVASSWRCSETSDRWQAGSID